MSTSDLNDCFICTHQPWAQVLQKRDYLHLPRRVRGQNIVFFYESEQTEGILNHAKYSRNKSQLSGGKSSEVRIGFKATLVAKLLFILMVRAKKTKPFIFHPGRPCRSLSPGNESHILFLFINHLQNAS